MRTTRNTMLAAGTVAALVLLVACNRKLPTGPLTDQGSTPSLQKSAPAAPTPADATLPTGEHMIGKAAIEPAYDDVTGNLIYILTPVNAPLPTHANPDHAAAPLYIVAYPPSSKVASDYNLNCEGVPGNCPDHDGLIAGVATRSESAVYGSDSTAVPGHDHLLAPPASHGDFNIAWEVKEVVFTPKGEADGLTDTHLTTKAQIAADSANDDVQVIDLGFTFTCAVVSAATYEKGTPIG